MIKSTTMKTFIGLIVIALSFFLYACQKVITITPTSYIGKVSIQSMLEPDSLPVVYFNRTIPYFGKDLKLGALVIRNAIVKITSSSGIDNLRLDSVFNRIYCEYDYYYKGGIPI